jgi:DNA-binding response OmpR family regulator
MSFSSSNQCNNKNNTTHIHLPNSRHILIVDDESDILSVIRRPLEEYGFNTCCFTKPTIALEHYRTSYNNHDLVISYLQMPIVSSFEFIRKVKDINPNVKAFLMTSGFELSDSGLLLSPNNSSSVHLMIDQFILKLFSIQELVVLIRKHIGVT